MADDDIAAPDNTPDDPVATPLPHGDNPMSEPDDVPATDGALDDTHPATDTGIQPEEEYDEGLSGAAEAEEPHVPAEADDDDPLATPGA
jgi:hypothetical protein